MLLVIIVILLIVVVVVQPNNCFGSIRIVARGNERGCPKTRASNLPKPSVPLHFRLARYEPPFELTYPYPEAKSPNITGDLWSLFSGSLMGVNHMGAIARYSLSDVKLNTLFIEGRICKMHTCILLLPPFALPPWRDFQFICNKQQPFAADSLR